MRHLTVEQEVNLRKAVLDQPLTQRTNAQIAEQIGCSARTVTNYKKEIASTLQTSAEQNRIKSQLRSGEVIAKDLLDTGGLSSQGVPSARSILESFPDAQILSPDEAMRLLSILAQEAAPAVQVSALKLLDDLQARHRPPASLGPPPPMTDSQKVSRLARLMDAVGPRISRLAAEEAFPLEPSDAEASVSSAP